MVAMSDIALSGSQVMCVCWFCGGSFWSDRSTAQYCCAGHKQKAYRWRVKITQQKVRAMRCINELAQYLDYDRTTPQATMAFQELRVHIVEALLKHKVKIVK